MWLMCRVCKIPAAAAGALLLAAMFPNATYLGLPVLKATLGPWASRIAIQYDLFACTPLLFTVGILIARHYGESRQGVSILQSLLRIPPVWAALAALVMNLADVPRPAVVSGLLGTLSSGVVPLMLFSLGLSLQWDRSRWRLLPSVIPVVVIQLLLVPLLVWGLAIGSSMQGAVLGAVVLEAAMPSMVLGIVICERYNLDNALYATAVTVTTVVSLVTLPMWIWVLQGSGYFSS
jgi:predicted permease